MAGVVPVTCQSAMGIFFNTKPSIPQPVEFAPCKVPLTGAPMALEEEVVDDDELAALEAMEASMAQAKASAELEVEQISDAELAALEAAEAAAASQQDDMLSAEELAALEAAESALSTTRDEGIGGDGDDASQVPVEQSETLELVVAAKTEEAKEETKEQKRSQKKTKKEAEKNAKAARKESAK